MQKRICFFVGNMGLGGIGKLTLHLVEEFVKKGIMVDLFLYKDDGEYMDQIPKEVRIFVHGGSYLGRMVRYISYLNKEKPMVSISSRQRQDILNVIGCLISYRKVQPVISIHTNVSAENKEQIGVRKKSIFIEILSKLLYKVPNKFIAVSKGVADDFAKWANVKRTEVEVIYNPVYKPYTELRDVQIPLTYEQLLREDKKYIIGVGRLTKAKDFFTLIKSYHIVKQKMDVALIILGEGPLRKELENLITELNLEKDVFLLGFVHNPQYYIRRASAFVLSSIWEGFGNVIVEAMGVGTPIISTNCPSGPAEILEDGKYGKLVSVGNLQEMANAMIDTLSTPHNPDVLIERAKDFYTEKIAQEYLDYIFEENP
ncbi:glycosyltransferase [Sinomicrobium weinanense]|uniref:Glycosyltransferase n=1 Tax=Sinomicrobium weinanense TaxID=2842200 RepID=A0A926Q407_9FLAO|nr:glycosyltransferase [Sinomicrobium weinanense]MBC9798127.1 glycosyltransferase [Sinomicrobium weinanense]MBU3123712.1 glycosyltransferase [Sinomicrobium weinanense]